MNIKSGERINRKSEGGGNKPGDGRKKVMEKRGEKKGNGVC